MTLNLDDALARSRDEPAFSNSDHGEAWLARWCDRCARDAPFRNGLNSTGCPLIAVSLLDRTPAEWQEQRAGDRSTYVCVEFRAQGGARTHRRREQTDGLFDEPKAAEQ